MADLIAAGKDPRNTWRRTFPASAVTLGRLADRSAWDVPWDRKISGLHAVLIWQHGALLVRKDPAARNHIFYQGRPLDEFRLGVGEHFVIGETRFTVHDSEAVTADDLPAPGAELTCTRQELQQVKYADADQRIEVLAALPGIIRFSPSDEALEGQVLDVLLQGIPRADVAAVVWLNPSATGSGPEIRVCRSARRPGFTGEFRPSRRLIVDALLRRRQSVRHSWPAGHAGDFTVTPGVDWAVCAPLPDAPSPGWGLYVAGQLRTGSALEHPADEQRQKSDLKFAELVADIFGALRQVRDLQARQATLARFFSRPVLAALAEQDIAEVLRPRETEVTVLFCDLRGSCQIAEDAEQPLAQACERVSEALGIMTNHIIDKDGVIGDFHGDAAMGFWGWPLGLDDRVEQAARAALAIRRDFLRAARQPGALLASFACGIGIASGPSIAGRLGTADQFKVTVFGPVVNLAARLESMTKFFHVPILLDEHSAARLASGRTGHWARCRRLAQVRPYGMRRTVLISELLPPAVEPGTMPEQDRRDYEAALDAFLGSRWEVARKLLERLPSDGPGEVLQAFMRRHGHAPPEGWDGVMALESK